jgi:hypothetical protein
MYVIYYCSCTVYQFFTVGPSEANALGATTII